MPFPFLDTTNDYSPINDVQPVTFGATGSLPNGPCRGFIVTAAGTVTLTTAKGTSVTLTFAATATGIVQYIRALAFTAGTATIFACY
jgi:hypothetical protein